MYRIYSHQEILTSASLYKCCSCYYQIFLLLAAMPLVLLLQLHAGDEFSVSDIAVSSYLLYLPLFFPTLDLSKWPSMLSYMARCADRPACPKPYKEAIASKCD
jgi:hypothetical protein